MPEEKKWVLQGGAWKRVGAPTSPTGSPRAADSAATTASQSSTEVVQNLAAVALASVAVVPEASAVTSQQAQESTAPEAAPAPSVPEATTTISEPAVATPRASGAALVLTGLEEVISPTLPLAVAADAVPALPLPDNIALAAPEIAVTDVAAPIAPTILTAPERTADEVLTGVLGSPARSLPKPDQSKLPAVAEEGEPTDADHSGDSSSRSGSVESWPTNVAAWSGAGRDDGPQQEPTPWSQSEEEMIQSIHEKARALGSTAARKPAPTTAVQDLTSGAVAPSAVAAPLAQVAPALVAPVAPVESVDTAPDSASASQVDGLTFADMTRIGRRSNQDLSKRPPFDARVSITPGIPAFNHIRPPAPPTSHAKMRRGEWVLASEMERAAAATAAAKKER